MTFLRAIVLVGLLAGRALAGELDATWLPPTTAVCTQVFLPHCPSVGTILPLTNLSYYRLFYNNDPMAATCPGAQFFTVLAPSPTPTPGLQVRAYMPGLQAGSLYTVAVTAVASDGGESVCSAPAQAVARNLPLTPLIPQTAWTVRFVDSQAPGYEAALSLDGNSGTMWHTPWQPVTPLPHEIQVDLGATYSISGFRYLPRQDTSPNGRIGQYEFYVSTDGVTWGTAAATGTFVNDAVEKEALFPARTGKFVRLRALTDASGNQFTSMAELNVLGVLSGQAPNPVTDLSISFGP